MINLGIVGVKRGLIFQDVNKVLNNVRILSIMDTDESIIYQWKKKYPDVLVYNNYLKFLEEKRLDAVFIATPISFHAEQTILALKAEKHVLCEIPVADRLREYKKLIKTVQKSSKIFMMAENYCYISQNRFISYLCKKKEFGNITFAEGRYIHDAKDYFWDENGDLTWRGLIRKGFIGNSYPTHSIGPISKWLNLGKDDFILTVSSFINGNLNLIKYAKDKMFDLGNLKNKNFKNGDTIITLLRTKNDVLICLYLDLNSPRPNQKAGCIIQGTKGAYISGRDDYEDGLIYINHERNNNERKWLELKKYSRKYFREEVIPENIKKMGRNGVNFLLLKNFIDSIIDNKESPIDIYDAVTWSSIIPLSMKSILKNSKPVKMPNFYKFKK